MTALTPPTVGGWGGGREPRCLERRFDSITGTVHVDVWISVYISILMCYKRDVHNPPPPSTTESLSRGIR